MIGKLTVTCFCSINPLRRKRHHIPFEIVCRVEDTLAGRVLSHTCRVIKKPLAPVFRW